MNRNRPGGGNGPGKHRRPASRTGGKGRAGAGKPRPPRRAAEPLRIVERSADTSAASAEPGEPGPFRVLIAVHRPRFRGRAERAAALVGWEVTALLNKQDPVGQVAKGPRPPDLLVLSGDFGRQRDYAIFRAVQPWRRDGMKLIGLVEDCQTAPEGYPDSVPERLCDVCLTPPVKTADLRALFSRLYETLRGEPTPPPIHAVAAEDDEDEE